MDDGGRPVTGVHAIERRAHDRGPGSPGVSLPHALVDGVDEQAAGHVHVLAQLHEANHEAGVLAVRNPLGHGELRVVLQDLQNLAPGSRALGGERPVEGAQHVGLERVVRVHAELLDGVCDRARVDLSHAGCPICAITAAERFFISAGDTSSLWVARFQW
jgi:hypothetical protein